MGDFRVNSTKKICVAVFCTIVGAVYSTGMGKCPLYPQLPNFDIQRIKTQYLLYILVWLLVRFYRHYGNAILQMTGVWFEVERSFYLMEMVASCTELNVTLSERGHLLITVDTVNRWTDAPSTTHGIGIPSFDGSSSFRYKLNNRLPYIIGRLLPGAGQYNILFTDYDNFALVWSCTSVSIAHSDRIWVLGRAREIEAEVRAQIYAIMEELHLDPDRLIVSKNNNCTDLNV